MNALKIHLFIILLFPFSGIYAQTAITGRILNERTKEAVPFAAVSFLNTKNGVSADVNGVFKLKLVGQNAKDTLLFTGIGFKNLKIALRDFISPFEVHLEENVETLNEVTVSEKRKELQIGTLNPPGNARYINYGSILAKRFEIPGTYQYLKEIIILRDIYYLNQSTETKFRINIYDENPETKGPGKKICLDTIEVNDLNNTKIKIDVSKYNISILSSPIFVAVETLPIPYNERYRIYRAGKIVDGIREYPSYYEVCYQPHLSIGYSKNNEGWEMRLNPGSPWRKVWFVPAIKIVVN